MHQDEQLMFPLVTLGTSQIIISMLYVHGLFALTFLQKQPQCPLILPEPSTLTFKTLPSGCKNLGNLGPLTFQTSCYGGLFNSCSPLSVSLSLTLLCACSFLLTIVAMINLSPKPCLHASCLLQNGLFSTFSCRYCSVSLQVNFWSI